MTDLLIGANVYVQLNSVRLMDDCFFCSGPDSDSSKSSVIMTPARRPCAGSIGYQDTNLSQSWMPSKIMENSMQKLGKTATINDYTVVLQSNNVQY